MSRRGRRASEELAVSALGVAVVIGGGHVEVIQSPLECPFQVLVVLQGDRVAAADDLGDHHASATKPAVRHAGLLIAALARRFIGGPPRILAVAGVRRRACREGQRRGTGTKEVAPGVFRALPDWRIRPFVQGYLLAVSMAVSRAVPIEVQGAGMMRVQWIDFRDDQVSGDRLPGARPSQSPAMAAILGPLPAPAEHAVHPEPVLTSLGRGS